MLRNALMYLRSHPLLAVMAVTATLACGSDTTEPGGNPGMTLALDPTSATVVQGGSTDVTGTLTRTGGFTGTATITVTGAPAGVTGTVSNEQTSGSVTTVTMTVDVGSSVAPGTYNLTARASGNGVSDATATFALTVAATPAYTMTLDPAALSVDQGANGTSTVMFARTNFTGGIALTLEGAPTGVSGSFNPTPATANSSVLTVSVDPSVAEGTYDLTVRGTASGLADRTATLALTVTAPPPFTIGLDPNALTIVKGEDGQATVTITRNTFNGAVTLALGSAPAGVTGVFDPAAPMGNSSTLTITVDVSVAAGTYDLTVDATAAAPIAEGDGGSVAANEAMVDQSAPLSLTVAEPASYTLGLDPNALSIQQGASGQTAVTITRTNFSGAVTLSLGNAPANVTGTFDPAAPTGNSSTLTVNVGGSVAPGVYNLTVEGTGTAGDKSVSLTLTVTAAPGSFTFSMAPDAVSVQQGAASSSTININRIGGFSDNVSFSVTGAPAGMTATPNPASTTGNTSTLDINVGAGVATGTHTLTVHGNATGLPEQTATVDVTVTPSSGGGSGTIDFSLCEIEERPVWLAFQDGSGPWTQITGAADSYDFTISSDKGGVAWVTDDGAGNSTVNVQYMTKAELTAETLRFCEDPNGKVVNFTVAGMALGDVALVSLGRSNYGALFDGSYSISGVQDGALDMFAYKRQAVVGVASTDQLIVRRGQNIPNNGSLATIDFGTAEAVSPAGGDITLAGSVGGASIVQSMNYLTATGPNGCSASPLWNSVAGGSTTFTVYGVPSNLQVNGDFHALTVFEDLGTPNIRGVSESFKTMGNRTLTLGAALSAPTLTTLAGPYKRLQSDFALPAEYGRAVSFSYFDQNNEKTVLIYASSGWVGGTSGTISMPDFSVVANWMNSWAPASAASTNYGLAGFGGSAQDVCTEGARSIFAVRTGATP